VITDSQTPNPKHGPKHYHLEHLKQNIFFCTESACAVFDAKYSVFHNEEGLPYSVYFTDKKCEFLVNCQKVCMTGRQADDSLAMLRASLPQNLCPFVKEEVSNFLGFSTGARKKWPERSGDVKLIVDAVTQHKLLDTLESRTTVYQGSPMAEIDHRKELRWFFKIIIEYHDLELIKAADRGPRAHARKASAITPQSKLIITPVSHSSRNPRKKDKPGANGKGTKPRTRTTGPKKTLTKLGLRD
jgi:hypothetical protein